METLLFTLRFSKTLSRCSAISDLAQMIEQKLQRSIIQSFNSQMVVKKFSTIQVYLTF